MDTKHTPGPWIVQGDTYVTVNSLIIAHCKQAGNTTLEEAQANARLIAAAPDMLELLELIESAGEDQFNAMDLKFALDHLRNIKALCAHAIAKARGQK